MVKVPRFGRLRIPQRITQRWRARLRAQRRWWRDRWRASAGSDVLFPAAGAGMVAVDTLSQGPANAGQPRIAILHATAGSGHKRAAQALAQAFSQLSPGVSVREVDTLVYASRLYRSAYATSYNAMAARAPRLWGVLYHSWALAPAHPITTPPGRGIGHRVTEMRLALDRLNLRRLVRVCERERPDALVCTHFLPVEALSYVRGRGRLNVPVYCVITDFTAHPFWVFPHVDRYFVAHQRVADELTGMGVPAARIQVTGIPIDCKFGQSSGRAAARQRLGVPESAKLALVMGGGSGVGPLVELAERIAGLAPDTYVTVLCGTNARLRARIDRLPAARAGRVRALGFTDQVDAWLEASDVLVSKAGGLTCSEALVKQVPLVIFRPTPGQEVANADFLTDAGAATHADAIDEVESAIRRILTDASVRDRMRVAAGRAGRPDAARDVARRVLDELSMTAAGAA